MEKLVKINKGQNCLIISLSGDQRNLKIFDAGGNLLRHDQTPSAVDITHLGPPGEYKLETDGTIKQVVSSFLKLDEPR